ncbi:MULTISPECIES: DNA cytosine methyltransferase [Peptoniphilaceae]|uniref:Cytosine-specific methyltransferase n=2 Tax=Peptoniphilaceae TaxID=1570339 RepID=A0A379C6X3_9FIRM|nr:MULTISPECIES: DNA cytosine methyltransferase [Peptoniphilaceae]MBS5965814.1 DNA cytosine methyltransferase [Finegoldia magna]MDU1642616.1 DNA cytosine methyltransferase [Peptoniphilus harei]MDU4025737.1 DNA cytosine methyltransferase [Anaerococcus sp.]OXZ24971.1 DNA (cytosine-5-)-methyltransferase [Finegoldia magna]SUB57337.1 Modification methylase HaeIII [Peptoniphilus lacrimalis]
MRVIDLFAGGGGLSEGFRYNEFKFICHIEKDYAACLTLKLRNVYYYLKNLDSLEIYNEYLKDNITFKELLNEIPENVIEDVLNYEINDESITEIFNYIDKKIGEDSLDGIIGGPPCQAYSTIGRGKNKHKKETDERIYLYEYYIEFLEKYKPKFFIFENVNGLLSFRDFNHRRLLPIILESFDIAGYNVKWQIVNTEDYGIAQKRERLFLVGFRKDLNLEKNFFEVLGQYKCQAPTITELFEDLPDIKAGEQKNEYSKSIDSSLVTKEYRDILTDVLTQHISRPNNENDLKIYKLVSDAKKHGVNLKYNELPEELITHTNTKSFLDRYKAIDGDSVSHTVVAHISKDGHYYIHPDSKQNRSISVREAARIQGFPDNYYFETSRTSAFIQIGNAVPPKLSRKLAMSILEILIGK